MPLQQITATDIQNGTITGSDIASGTITGSNISANTISNTAFQTGSVENYMSAQGTPLGGMRNKIINGAMMIDQRNAGASVTPVNNGYLLDRWKFISSQAAKFTAQQNAGSVIPPSGFANYLGFTSSSAFSVGASDYFNVLQIIEGFNASDLSYGTSSAKTSTLSFWAYSSLTGTFSVVIGDGAYTYGYGATYSIPVANTWTYITLSIPGATTGTWNKTNSNGLAVYFNLGAGASASMSAGSWGAWAGAAVTGSVSVVGTSGATWYVTGVQLEKGATATPFENRLYGTELALCQRYYYKGSLSGGGCTNGTSASYPAVAYPTPMRTAPTIGWISGGRVGDGVTDTAITGLGGTIGVGETSAALQINHASAFAAGNGAIMFNTPVFSLSAEL